MMRIVPLAATLAALLGGLAAPVAQAAFPGENGPVAEAWSGAYDRENDDGSMYVRTFDTLRLIDSRDGISEPLRCDHHSDQPEDVPCAEAAYADPAFAPNGRRLAVIADGYVTIFTVDGRQLRQLDTPGGAADPAFSPDGRRIVVSAGATTRSLWVISLDGAPPRRLTRGAEPDWSTRGWIAFVRDGEVWRIRPNGRGPRRLTTPPRVHGTSSPSWAPDGRRLAFACEACGGVFTIAADGRHRRRITSEHGPDGIIAWGVVWSPDGRKLLVESLSLVTYDLRTRRSGGFSDSTESISSNGSSSMHGFDWGPLPR